MQADPFDPPNDEAVPPESAESSLSATDPAEPTPRLLVADDSAVQRHALSLFLRRSGYDVAEAADGRAAVEHLKNAQVDLLLLDLNMPQGDGFDVLTYLQGHRRSLPVLLLSGMAVDDIQQKMSKLPQKVLPPLLLKPVDPEQLIQMVELHLSGQMPGLPGEGSAAK